MKICPFISHMIGEDGTNVLEAGSSTRAPSAREPGVVILGYDGSDSSAVATATQTKKKTKARGSKKKKSPEQSHLFCLKETCRFYHKKDASCTFDNIFEMVGAQAKAASKKPAADPAEKSMARVTKELDKFWKFQTRSVSELIASIGDAEKKQGSTLSQLEKSIENALQSLGENESDQVPAAIREDIAHLSQSIADREESVESFSTTISELIINIEDGMKELGERTNGLSERIDQVAPALGSIDEMERRVLDAVEKQLASHASDADSNRSGDILRSLDEIKSTVADATKSDDQWRDQIDSRIAEICATQSNQNEEMATLQHAQARVVELLENRPAPVDEDARARHHEARKLNNFGVRSFHNNDLSMAREQFEQAVELDPRFAEAWNNLGLVFTELDENDPAMKAFERAIDANPDLHTAYSNLGYVYYRAADYENAAQLYTRALDRREDSSSNWTNLGNARYHLGDSDGARAAWERAVELEPDNSAASESLAKIRS